MSGNDGKLEDDTSSGGTSIRASIQSSTLAASAQGPGAQAHGTVNVTNNHYYQGISREQAIQLFQEMLVSDGPKYQKIAIDVARQRTRELASNFSHMAVEEGVTPEQLGKLAEPDVQYTLNAAIQSSARRDSEELRKVLARLILRKLKSLDGDMWSVTLSEAVSAAGKLTPNQLRIVALSFVTSYVNWCASSCDWKTCNTFLKDVVEPFLETQVSEQDLLHLEYAGCGTINRGARHSLEVVVRGRYGSLFPKESGGHRPDSAALLATIGRESPVLMRLHELSTKTRFDTLVLTSVGLALATTIVEQVTGRVLPIETWFPSDKWNVNGAFVYS